MEQERITISSLPRLGRICIASEFCYGLCVGAWSIALNFHLSYCGVSGTQIGALLSLGYIVTAIVSFFVGRVGDIKGYPFVMSMGAAMMGCALIVISFARQLPLFYLAHMTYCAGLACVMAMEFNLPLSLVKDSQRQYSYNLVLIYYFLGSITGNLLCTICFGSMKGQGDPYQWVLLICGVIYLGLSVFRGKMPRQAASGGAGFDFKGIWSNLRSPKIPRYLIYGFLTFGLFTLSTGMLNLVLREWHGMPDTTVSIAFMVNSAVGCLMLVLLPMLSRRFALHKLSIAALILQFLALALMTAAPTGVFVAMMFLRTASCNVLYTSVDSPMLQSIEADRRGTYAGMRIFANYMGNSAAAVVSGILVEKGSFTMLFIVCAAVALTQTAVYQFLCWPKLKASKN